MSVPTLGLLTNIVLEFLDPIVTLFPVYVSVICSKELWVKLTLQGQTCYEELHSD